MRCRFWRRYLALRHLQGPLRHRGLRPACRATGADRRAGAVGDLSVVDLNWPFAGFEDAGRRQGGARAQRAARRRYHAGDLQPRLRQGSITNPDPAVRAQALKLLNEATELAKELDCDYVKLWFGQDGWDYPFQVDYHDIWKLAVERAARARRRLIRRSSS